MLNQNKLFHSNFCKTIKRKLVLINKKNKKCIVDNNVNGYKYDSDWVYFLKPSVLSIECKRIKNII